jgi:hypothetical protein
MPSVNSKPDTAIPQDYLTRTFHERFVRAFPDELHTLAVTDRLQITIPNPVSEDRELWISMDGDEVTVGIGQYHHRHFSFYNYGDAPTDEVMSTVIDDSIDFIQVLLGDQIIVRVFFDGDRICGSSTGDSNVFTPSASRTSYRDFTWTGELRS